VLLAFSGTSVLFARRTFVEGIAFRSALCIDLAAECPDLEIDTVNERNDIKRTIIAQKVAALCRSDRSGIHIRWKHCALLDLDDARRGQFLQNLLKNRVLTRALQSLKHFGGGHWTISV
jgi:hypothetical protein